LKARPTGEPLQWPTLRSRRSEASCEKRKPKPSNTKYYEQHTEKGKVAVIGAGAKNLGGLISREFTKDGAKVVVHYNSDATRRDAEATVQAVKDLGGDAYATQGDLTKPASVAAVFEQATDRFGGIDIAVNTVGKVLRKPIIDTTEEEYDSMFDINAKAAYFFIKEAGKNLNDNGKIITIVTSLLAAFTDGYSTYAGGKAPVEHFTRAAAKEFGPRGISVTGRSGSDGHPVFLQSGNARARDVSQVTGHERRADQDRGHCAHYQVPCH
jgi:NADP-dependent 3-hydroxy acid dehydrogenase YdfG